MALPSPLSILSPIATLSARHPAQRAIAVAISSSGTRPPSREDLDDRESRRVTGLARRASLMGMPPEYIVVRLCAPRPFGRGRALPRGPEVARAPEPRLAAGLGTFV